VAENDVLVSPRPIEARYPNSSNSARSVAVELSNGGAGPLESHEARRYLQIPEGVPAIDGGDSRVSVIVAVPRPTAVVASRGIPDRLATMRIRTGNGPSIDHPLPDGERAGSRESAGDDVASSQHAHAFH